MTFDQWIAYVFDHPVTKPEWYWENDDWEGSSAEIIAHLTRTFEECETALNPFSDAQAAQGLDFLVSNCLSGYMQELKEVKVPLGDRLRCVEAMATLFERYFAKRCTPHLSHLSMPEPGVSPLNGVCFLWWETLPLHGMVYHHSEHPDAAELDRKFLEVISRCLEIDSVACQESALLGLFEWSSYYHETTLFMDDFLRRDANIRHELKAYAVRLQTCSL